MKAFLIVLGALASASAGLAPVAVLPRGHGLEGAWIPDLNEKLHDDGSYRPQARAIELAPSPYGLTPAGSGLEGAYVPQARAIELAPSPYGLTPAGSGLEGAYVPEARPIELAASPYGLTPAGSGLEGAYVEPARAVPLANSPYGLTVAGSGLEGAYVHDITEKLYDDGSYRHHH